jgi:hypothetical protein
MSGRSGESEDVTLSHLAVGLLADQIKVGSITRSERTAKWNEALRIEETLSPGRFRRARQLAARRIVVAPATRVPESRCWQLPPCGEVGRGAP